MGLDTKSYEAWKTQARTAYRAEQALRAINDPVELLHAAQSLKATNTWPSPATLDAWDKLPERDQADDPAVNGDNEDPYEDLYALDDGEAAWIDSQEDYLRSQYRTF